MCDTKQERIKAADEYWTADLKNQQEWYSKKSATAKKYYRLTGLLIICLSAIVSFIQVFSPGPNLIAIITTLIGLVIILLKNLEGIYMLDETWIAYRSISEAMKRERRLFINMAGEYKALDDKSAYIRFVENTEQRIKNEHESWKSELEASPKADSLELEKNS